MRGGVLRRVKFVVEGVVEDRVGCGHGLEAVVARVGEESSDRGQARVGGELEGATDKPHFWRCCVCGGRGFEVRGNERYADGDGERKRRRSGRRRGRRRLGVGDAVTGLTPTVNVHQLCSI